MEFSEHTLINAHNKLILQDLHVSRCKPWYKQKLQHSAKTKGSDISPAWVNDINMVLAVPNTFSKYYIITSFNIEMAFLGTWIPAKMIGHVLVLTYHNLHTCVWTILQNK